MCVRTVRDTGRRSFPSSARALINARRPHAQPLAAREEVLVGESAPFPLTRRVPFRHDVPNGERGGREGRPSPGTPPSSSSGRWSSTASAGARTRSSPASRAATRGRHIGPGQEGGRPRAPPPRPEPLSRWPGEPRRPRRENDRLRTENEMLFKKPAPSSPAVGCRVGREEGRVRVHIGQRGLLEGLGLIRRPATPARAAAARSRTCVSIPAGAPAAGMRRRDACIMQVVQLVSVLQRSRT